MNEWKKKWIKEELLEERMNKGWMSERKNELKMNDWKKELIKDEWVEERINNGWMKDE